MLARDNYSYKKYQKELAKKKKREEKIQNRLNKKNIQAVSEADSGQGPATAGQISNEDVAN